MSSYYLLSSDNQKIEVDLDAINKSKSIKSGFNTPGIKEFQSHEYKIDTDIDTLQILIDLIKLNPPQILSKLKTDQRQLVDLFNLKSLADRYHFDELSTSLINSITLFITDSNFQTKEGAKIYQQISSNLQQKYYKMTYLVYEDTNELVGVFSTLEKALQGMESKIDAYGEDIEDYVSSSSEKFEQFFDTGNSFTIKVVPLDQYKTIYGLIYKARYRGRPRVEPDVTNDLGNWRDFFLNEYEREPTAEDIEKFTIKLDQPIIKVYKLQ